ncbi:MAG: ABC transporter ATP-binding protein [Methanoregulaceae archaeon]|jgi:NitT/TauT family transport system ATP-binding protein|nr:ABC transporter ATP-binding protein [Methanoregulaceae archaeon]
MRLCVQHLTKEFTGTRGERVLALSDISLDIEPKEFICLLGPSGCGKTTLLRIIGGLEQATSGCIAINSHHVSGPDPMMAMIFQEYSLFPWRTIRDNIAFGLEIRNVQREEREEAVDTYLSLVGLTEFAESYPYELSGGMRQRVAVARALAINPGILLMDEPFGALDAQTRNMMQRELLDIWEKTKKTIIFVTHSVDEAVFLADRIVVLTPRPGTIREVIPIDLPRPRDRTSEDFLRIRRFVLSLIDETMATREDL